MVIVDAHVHFWDPGLLHYEWLQTVPVLRRAFGPADFRAATGGTPVDQVVVVEGNCAPEENVLEAEYFARPAESVRVAGIVAFADLTRPNELDRTLDVLSPSPKVKGVRQNIQGQPLGFCLQDRFVEGARKVGRRGLTFDLCITHDQCRDATELVRRCPDTSFVLDHCGKPAIRDRCVEPWRSDIRRLAEHENVCCKLSGLLTEADTQEWRAEDLMPYASRVTECFGTDRLMYGSDWPVLTLAGDYRDWFGFTESFTGDWSQTDRNGFYHGNAKRVYRL